MAEAGGGLRFLLEALQFIFRKRALPRNLNRYQSVELRVVRAPNLAESSLADASHQLEPTQAGSHLSSGPQACTAGAALRYHGHAAAGRASQLVGRDRARRIQHLT